MVSTILLVIAFLTLITVASIFVYILNRGNKTSVEDLQNNLNSQMETRIRQYEESTNRLLEETRRHYEQQISLLEQRLERQAKEVQQQSSMEFSALAGKALENQAETLRRNNRNELDSILSPLREKLTDFQKAVTDSYVNENSQREALSQKIEILARTSNEIGVETRRLSNALRGNVSMQGKWGETVLEELLQRAGFIPNVHYITQRSVNDGETVKTDEGQTLRPDVMLNLPGKHKIIIDSKASMTAYLKYSEAESETEAKLELKKHALSTKKHVDELASKQYHKNIVGALEHTLMFMPNDAAYLAAIRGDTTLPEYALSKNVAIVSPAHLLSVVQLISQLWRVENQNRNAENIAILGGQLYDKIVGFVADFESINRSIDSARSAYDKCLKHLSQGRGNLLNRAEKLRGMGAKASKQLPERLLFDPDSNLPESESTPA